jgi:hypothetical protein
MCSYGLRMYISAVEKPVKLSIRTDFPIGVLSMALVEPSCRGFRSVRGLLRRPLTNIFDATNRPVLQTGEVCTIVVLLRNIFLFQS